MSSPKIESGGRIDKSVEILYPKLLMASGKIRLIFLAGLLFLAFFVRFYSLDRVPASLYYDEVDYGYQAKSLIETGKDYRGELSPFYVHSFNDIRAPIPAYFAVLTTLVFNSPELKVRMPSVLTGVLIVFLAYYLVLLITKNFWAAFLTGLVFASSPWQIQYSRFSHEAMPMLLFYLLGVIFFYKAIQGKRSFRHLILSAVLFSLSVYCYRTMSFFVPLTFLIIFLIYKKELLSFFGLKKLSLIVLVSGVIIVPFLYATTFGAPDLPRINQLSITSNPQIPIWVQRNREIDSNDFLDPEIGKRASTLSFFFHSKPLSYFNTFWQNYYRNFSPDFLFIKGDPNLRQSIGKTGELFYIDILPLFAGLFYLFKKLKLKENQFLLVWFLAAPIPASLTIDGAQHASRLFIFSAPLLILIGFGWWQMIIFIRKIKFNKLFYAVIFGLWIFLFVFYLHNYFVHYPIDSARDFGYGFKQIMTRLSAEEPKFDKVLMGSSNDPPIIYYLFWSNTNPSFLHQHGTAFSQTYKDKNNPLNKIAVIDWPQDKRASRFSDNLEDNVLYLLTQKELLIDLQNGGEMPEGVQLLYYVNYPDNETSFYLVAKKT